LNLTIMEADGLAARGDEELVPSPNGQRWLDR